MDHILPSGGLVPHITPCEGLHRLQKPCRWGAIKSDAFIHGVINRLRCTRIPRPLAFEHLPLKEGIFFGHARLPCCMASTLAAPPEIMPERRSAQASSASRFSLSKLYWT